MSLTRRTTVAGALYAAGTALGFINFMLLARRAGLGVISDGYFLAHTACDIVLGILLLSEFQPAFQGHYRRAAADGRGRAALGAMGLALALLLAPVVIAGVWFAPQGMHLLASQLDPARAEVTVAMLRWLLPAMLLQYLIQPLLCGCYDLGASWVEPFGLLLLTLGLSAVMLLPGVDLLWLARVHLAGFALIGLIAWSRLRAAGVHPAWPQPAEMRTAWGVLRGLTPFAGVPVARALYRAAQTAFLARLPGGVVTLASFAEKMFGAGNAFLSQSFVRVVLPDILRVRKEKAAAAGAAFCAAGTAIGLGLACGLAGGAPEFAALLLRATTGDLTALAVAILVCTAPVVLLGAAWECVRVLCLAQAHARAVARASLVSQIAGWLLLVIAVRALPPLPLMAAALPSVTALALALSLFIALPSLGLRLRDCFPPWRRALVPIAAAVAIRGVAYALPATPLRSVLVLSLLSLALGAFLFYELRAARHLFTSLNTSPSP